MFTLDLRLAILLLGVLLTLLIAAALWLDRRWRRHHPSATLWQHLPIGLCILSRTHMLDYANPMARRLLALPATPTPLPDSAWQPLLLEDVRLATQSQMVIARTFLLESAAQWRRWQVVAQEGRIYVVVEDATTLQNAERHAHRMVSDLSHEIRTPVATLLTHIEVLKLPHLPDATRAQSLTFMQAEGQRLDHLVQHMSDLNRLETAATIETRAVDVVGLVEEVLAQCQPAATAAQMEMALRHDGDVPPILGDRGRLKQLFLNLVENALKYCRPQDRLIVHLQRTTAGVSCAVADTGPGIAASHLPHLTQRFYRVGGERVRGSGLGLALAAEILRRHQSHLTITSRTETPTGTTFTFVLPYLERET